MLVPETSRHQQVQEHGFAVKQRSLKHMFVFHGDVGKYVIPEEIEVFCDMLNLLRRGITVLRSWVRLAA
jgi:hypothetical protein